MNSMNKANETPTILAIETSCDDTTAAIIASDKNDRLTIKSSIVSSQTKIHQPYGGVYPTLAAREHEKNIIPVIKEALKQSDLNEKNIDLIAVTVGPGLMPSLVVGIAAARSLSWVWQKPLLGIHHISGHIYANFINSAPSFPLLNLVVSGGHTQLILMRNHLEFEIIGQTRDDAVGEAFDKVARMLGLNYPGGPALAREADKYTRKYPRNLEEVKNLLPRPMLNDDSYDFSFSGIKTSVLYKISDWRQKNNLSDNKPLPAEYVGKMSFAFEEAICDVLIAKTIRAAKKYHVNSIALAGGVAANYRLRTRLEDNIKQSLTDTAFYMPKINYCMDNAAMIATTAYFHWKQMTDNERADTLTNWQTLDARADTSIDNKYSTN